MESGLNGGGHAFATDGFLMGPILAEFRDNREDLINSIHELLVQSLTDKNRLVPQATIDLKVTAQGGVGTAEEHQFLRDHYNIDSVGWGTPFLLVPEVTNVDDNTRNQLMGAKEKDLYLSEISPLGVPFNSLRGNTKDAHKMELIDKGRPGSSCPKKYLVSNTEFTEKAICSASRQYQKLKLEELDKEGLFNGEYQVKFDKIVDKSCICVGLGTTALQVNDLSTKVEGDGISICPGPNMAYFSKIMSLKELTDHIYGRINVISRTDRPNMFIKELNLYIDYLTNKIEEVRNSMSVKQGKYLTNFASNLNDGINYYHKLFDEVKHKYKDTRSGIVRELEASRHALNQLNFEIESISLKMVIA